MLSLKIEFLMDFKEKYFILISQCIRYWKTFDLNEIKPGVKFDLFYESNSTVWVDGLQII